MVSSSVTQGLTFPALTPIQEPVIHLWLVDTVSPFKHIQAWVIWGYFFWYTYHYIEIASNKQTLEREQKPQDG